MERETLLNIVFDEETQRILHLNRLDLLEETSEWFGLDVVEYEYFRTLPLPQIVDKYMDDYMSWKEDYSDEELLEFLTK